MVNAPVPPGWVTLLKSMLPSIQNVITLTALGLAAYGFVTGHISQTTDWSLLAVGGFVKIPAL